MASSRNSVSRSLLRECWEMLSVSGRRKRVSNSRRVISSLLSDKKCAKSARGFVFYLDGDIYELLGISNSNSDLSLSARRIPSSSSETVTLSLSDLELNGSTCLCMFAVGLLDHMLVSHCAWRSFCDSVDLRDCLTRIVSSGIKLYSTDNSYSYSLDVSCMDYYITDGVSVSSFCVSVDIEGSGDIVSFSLYDSEGKLISADYDALYNFIYTFIREF